MRELSRRLGLPEDSDEQIAQEFLGEHVKLEELKEKGWMKDQREHLLPKVKLGFTVHLPEQATTEYPLTLISPKSHHTMNSSFINQPRHQKAEGKPSLEMHPYDAAARGLPGEGWVRIFNPQGEVRAWLKVTDKVRPGVISLAGRWWYDQMGGTAPVNTLTPGRLASPRGQPTYNECFVEVMGIEGELLPDQA